MGQRLELHSVLLGLAPKAYFSPPPNLEMEYPCIVYKRDQNRDIYADNSKYFGMRRYLVTVIDQNPDSTIPESVDDLPYSSFVRSFTTENLNHFLYYLYF